MPRNSFRFFFGAHSSYADAAAMRPDFIWCTVYCPENASYGEANRTMHQHLSSGIITAKKAFSLCAAEGPFNLAQFRLIQSSHKRIELVDVPDESPIFARISFVEDEVRRTGYFDSGFAEACGHATGVIAAFVAVNRERERYVVEQLLRLDDELSDERILIRFGTAHYRMARLARMCGLRVASRFKSGGLGLFGLCYHLANCGRPIPTPVLAQYLMGELLLRYWPGPSMWLDDNELDTMLVTVSRRFTEIEIAEIWLRTRAEPDAATDIIYTALRQHGFPV